MAFRTGQFLRSVLSAIFLLAAPLATAQNAPADDASDTRIDPQAVEILEAATRFLAEQQRFSVTWFVSYDTVIDGREKITELRSGVNLLDRDLGFYALAENGMQTREYFFDTGSFAIIDVEENAYVLTPFNGSFEELVVRAREEYDVVLPVWTVMSRTSPAQYLEPAEHVAYLGMTRVAGRDAHHLALASYDGDWQVWVAADEARPEILMIVGTNPYEQGWPQYRVYFSDWNFAPEIAEGAFTFTPDEDARRMAWPKVRPEGGFPALSGQNGAQEDSE